jgi:hypothetical protein
MSPVQRIKIRRQDRFRGSIFVSGVSFDGRSRDKVIFHEHFRWNLRFTGIYKQALKSFLPFMETFYYFKICL